MLDNTLYLIYIRLDIQMPLIYSKNMLTAS